MICQSQDAVGRSATCRLLGYSPLYVRAAEAIGGPSDGQFSERLLPVGLLRFQYLPICLLAVRSQHSADRSGNSGEFRLFVARHRIG